MEIRKLRTYRRGGEERGEGGDRRLRGGGRRRGHEGRERSSFLALGDSNGGSVHYSLCVLFLTLPLRLRGVGVGY